MPLVRSNLTQNGVPFIISVLFSFGVLNGFKAHLFQFIFLGVCIGKRIALISPYYVSYPQSAILGFVDTGMLGNIDER